MASWTVYNLECADAAARETLMDWFEREHPVAFPADRYSVIAEVDTGSGAVEADFAWVGRYLYVTTRTDGGDLLRETMDRWERAAVATFDAGSGTAEEVTLVLDADAGGDDEAAGGRFEGVEGLGGMDVLYSLAMRHQFRFRSYAGVPPARHRGVHPDAFTVVDSVDSFVADMREATSVDPTDEGVAFLRADPAEHDRYVFGETYGPVDHEFDTGATGPFDAGDADDGEDGEDGETSGGLPGSGDVMEPTERPTLDDADSGASLLTRIRRLLGR